VPLLARVSVYPEGVPVDQLIDQDGVNAPPAGALAKKLLVAANMVRA
jgi:hypothetical protein